MPHVEFMGKSFRTDESGFIDNFDNWCEEWVQYIVFQSNLDKISL